MANNATGLPGKTQNKSNSEDDRLTGDNRYERDMSSREDGEDSHRNQDASSILSPQELRRALRSDWMQQILPNAPDMPGWHTCWLSTNSRTDSIQNRERMGYTPVKKSEMAGFDAQSMRSAGFDDLVTCNEMVLYKIPANTYQLMMSTLHHDMPIEAEASIRANAMRYEAMLKDEHGKKVNALEGYEDLGRPRRAPTFV